MADIFETTYINDKQELRKQKVLGRFLKLFSLGIFNNDKKIEYWSKKLEESEELLKKKKKLEVLASKYDEYENTINIEGIRVCKYTFADLSVLGSEKYPENWNQLRQVILERDGYQCQLADGYCNGPLQIHHKIELSKGGTNNPNNLVTLCKFHHYLQHKHLSGVN